MYQNMIRSRHVSFSQWIELEGPSLVLSIFQSNLALKDFSPSLCEHNWLKSILAL
jgi:hypothetical protein